MKISVARTTLTTSIDRGKRVVFLSIKKGELGVVHYVQRCDAYEGVESKSRTSRIKIYDTFDRSAVKIHNMGVSDNVYERGLIFGTYT